MNLQLRGSVLRRSRFGRVAWAALSVVIAISVAIRCAVKLRRRPDLVWAQGHDEVFAAGIVARVLRRPLVLTLVSPATWQGPIDDYSRWRRSGYRSASLFICVSQAQANLWLEAGLPRDRTIVVHDGIDTEFYRPPTEADAGAVRDDLGVHDSDRLIVVAGRLDEDKGIPGFVESFLDLDMAGELIQLCVLAVRSAKHDASEREWAREKEAEMISDWTHRSQRVHVLPEQLDVRPWFGAADVVVLPSLVAESFSRVVLEAMACGTPVVATARGGSPEALTGEYSQLLYDPNAPETLAAALRYAFDAKSSDDEFESRCRNHVVAQFSSERYLDLLEENFNLAARARPAYW